MSETTDTPLFDEDITVEDIIAEASGAQYHTILEAWREILKNADTDRKARITPMWAGKICAKYPQIAFSDMPDFNELFFHKIDRLAEIVDMEIDSDPECLNCASAEEDVTLNSHHYLNILVNWQKLFLVWELEWDCTVYEAAMELGAISETHRMFFGDTGLTGLLDQIGYTFSEENQMYLTEELEDLKNSWEG